MLNTAPGVTLIRAPPADFSHLAGFIMTVLRIMGSVVIMWFLVVILEGIN